MAKTAARKVLVVDDERTIREVLRRYLEREGFQVSEAQDGAEALAAASQDPPDLVVLDLMLPKVDGLEVARQLRSERRVPIVMLTAKGELEDRIEGLELGADDYIVKPFSPREVMLRVNAVLRRAAEGTIAAGEVVEASGLRLDPGTRQVSLAANPVDLTAKEFDLLYFLMQHPQQVFSREQLLDHVWGYEFYGDPSTVTVHIRRLREKIEEDPSEPKRLRTVWGVGYKYDG
ncbi:MAG TPA: response regulator transcription factor [Anaerolineales bacterium]|jgi:DNA-binding response OmpR family regulator